jgi:thymidylate synthase
LGVPYDIFSFAMVAAYVACQFNAVCKTSERVGLGHQTITMTSSHLYVTNYEAAKECVDVLANLSVPVPELSVHQGRWNHLRDELEITMETRAPVGPWQRGTPCR